MEALPQSVKYALDEHRRFLDLESEQRRMRADADEARDLRAMVTRADAEIAIEQRIAHARLAGAPENWLHEQNLAQYLAPMRVSEPDGRGRPACRNEVRNRCPPERQTRRTPEQSPASRQILDRSSQPNTRRTSPRAKRRDYAGAMQTPLSSQGAGYSWPQYWSYTQTAPSSSAVPMFNNLPPTGYVIGPVDERIRPWL
jgi:hypothetical protein